MDILHIDFEQPKDLVFNRARLRRAFAKIGQAHAHVARRLVRRIRGRSSRAGETPASQTGALARSIAYNIPRASKERPGLMVKIAPSWKRGKRKNLWGRGGVPIKGDLLSRYPSLWCQASFLWHAKKGSSTKTPPCNEWGLAYCAA